MEILYASGPKAREIYLLRPPLSFNEKWPILFAVINFNYFWVFKGHYFERWDVTKPMSYQIEGAGHFYFYDFIIER